MMQGMLADRFQLVTHSRNPYPHGEAARALITPLPWLLLEMAGPTPVFTRILIVWLVLAGLAHSELLAGQRSAAA
jgi:hypothetical protein